jgi:ring-1,2-phenylacetyl-CoA epoxidase subunit PaaE
MLRNLFSAGYSLDLKSKWKPMQLVDLRVLAIRVETIDTKSFVLEVPNKEPIDYEAGQFLTLIFPWKPNGERRSYSISSSRILNEQLTITVKRIDNGEFSRYLFDQCSVGSPLQTIGASGFFTLPNEITAEQEFFFLAAGSGITPMLPMIKQLLYRSIGSRVHLVYSNRREETTIFRSVILKLVQEFPERFHVVWLFSNAKDLMKARISKVYLSDFVKQWVEDRHTALFYLCGPKDYMQMVTITLLAEGIKATNVRKEIFDTMKMVVKELPPDVDAHQVTIMIGGKKQAFKAQFPETILTAARREGMTLPYSCEAGKCGTCVATCTSGRVWMSYNEVLVERELLQGRILTCTGYAVGGDVTVDYT